MHLEIRTVGKKRKCYLAHSFRRGEKIKKIRFYLGADLSKGEIQKKREHAEKVLKERMRRYDAIRDPFRTVLSPDELDKLKTLEPRGDIKVLHLDERDWARFTEEFTYDTNAIEGSTVTQSEVTGVLEKDRWPEKRTKYEISETYGVAEAVGYIRKTKTHISIDLIKKLHEIVFRNSKPFAGKFRKSREEVAVVDATGKVVHRGATASEISKLLDELSGWYNRNKGKYPPVVLAAVVHNQFENIHPFRDGNGRVGRLLLNNILLRHGLPPVNIELENRMEYYGALRDYQNDGNIRPMMELILKEYKALKRMFKNR